MSTLHASTNWYTIGKSEPGLNSVQSKINVDCNAKRPIQSQTRRIHKKQKKSAKKTPVQKVDSSMETISVQSLQDDKKDYKLPKIIIPYRNELFQKETTSDGDNVARKKPQRNGGLSSTNSNFENLIFNVPIRNKRKCSTTSSKISAFSLPKETLAKKNDIGSSQEMIDTIHAPSLPHCNLKGPEWAIPCKESFVAGAPRPYLGTCPPNVEKLVNFSKGRQKFFLTQDPRKKFCLTNPQVLRSKAYSKKKEFEILTSMVKHAENLCAGDEPQEEQTFICEVIDLENPLNLDFQGLDYQKTYTKDEQNIQKLRIYRRVRRYVDRRLIKATTGRDIQEEARKARIAIPECFAIPNRNQPIKIPTPEPSLKFGRLFRSTDKPSNKQRLAEEHENRKARYKDLHLRKMERDEKQEKERQKAAAKAKEEFASKFANEVFDNKVASIDRAIARCFKIERQLKKVEVKRRIFPHTLRETKYFKNIRKKEDRVRRHAAIVKKQFYLDRLQNNKYYPELEADTSSGGDLSQALSLSEQSSDDEDNIEVGLKDDIFRLRGFHFKLKDGIRGKRHQRETLATTHSKKKCITRQEWLGELFPKKEYIRVDVEQGIEKIKNPDDPDLDLFRPKFGFKPPSNKRSAIHEYVQRRIGRHYERNLRKNLKILKPRLKYSGKRFNMIGYLHGEFAETLAETKEAQIVSDHKNTKISVEEYIEDRNHAIKEEKKDKKYKRLKLLGIPCHEIETSRLERLCEYSESSDSEDWVPKPEWEYDAEEAAAKQQNEKKDPKDAVPESANGNNIAESSEESRSKAQRLTAGRSQKPSKIPIPIYLRGNMPAPQFREPTLRIHPRRPRDYAGERVEPEHFEEAVNTSGLPYMHDLGRDIKQSENVRVKKRPYTSLFEGRHHHDHWDPTQWKAINVHYNPKIVKPKLEKIETEADQKLMEHFHMANPPCNAFIDMDLTLSKANTHVMINEHTKEKGRKHTNSDSKDMDDQCKTGDFVFHSRPPGDLENLDYPGRKEFLQFLEEVKTAVSGMRVKEHGEEELCIDREDLIKELEEDLKSIESCLTSLDSSECTNLSNDSGSFLLMEDQWKVPLDYVRQGLVPFEELKRSRFEAQVIDVDAEVADPFKVFPFSGQRKEQLASLEPKDAFFTYNTRLKNDLRLRLEVPVEDVRKKLIGRGKEKHPALVLTDLDENYVTDLKDRPPIKMFNFKTGVSFVKDALRLKFESLMIQGQMVRKIIYDRLNEQNWENMLKMKDLYEKLFAKWEKREHAIATNIVYQVKKFYEFSDRLKVEYRNLEKESLLLNMDIVFLECRWIQRIMLQNFHYLLADQEWRHEHDWIHRKYKIQSESITEEKNSPNSKRWPSIRDEEYVLESYEESIAKRTTANIRKRDKDDAWAIKAFYEDFYEKNHHPILIVFPNAESFLKGIENLKLKTFVSLLELHMVLIIHTELQTNLETFGEWCLRDLKDRSYYVQRKCYKKYFMEDRADDLQRRVQYFLDQPLKKSYTDETFLKERAVIYEVWKLIVPASVRGSSNVNADPIDMVTMMFEVATDLLAKLENIPEEKRRKIEIELRKQRIRDHKISRNAYQIECRIENTTKKVLKNLEPPYKKPPYAPKTERSTLIKKVPSIVVKQRAVSEQTKFFYRAFHDDDDEFKIYDARESMIVIDEIKKQTIPFYFDHFLKTHGYKPNYAFKTQIELRDGPETTFFRKQALIPEVLKRMEEWEEEQQRIMEYNIQKNPRMYEYVN